MKASTRLGLVLLAAAALSPALGQAMTVEVRDLDLLVSGAPGNRRAEYPAHRVFVGDHAGVNAIVFHDGTLRNPLATFTTTAPVTAVTGHPAGAIYTGPASHLLPAGYATFTTAGRYRVSIHVKHDGGPETADGSFDIEVVSTEARAVPPSACLVPSLHFTNPGANGFICLNRPTPLTVAPTLRGCDPYALTISKENADGTWTSLGTHSGAPWTVTHAFTSPGPVRLKAELRDRNGGRGEALVSATVGACLDPNRFIVLEKQIKALPPPDKCPACGKLAARLDALRKQAGGGEPLKLLPAVQKELESLEADVKLAGKTK